jgi:hypothetical protein
MAAIHPSIDTSTHRDVVERIAEELEKRYIFPDVAGAMSSRLKSALEAGEYADLAEPSAFCERLTADLQAISRDKHIRVRYNAAPQAAPSAGDTGVGSPGGISEALMRLAARTTGSTGSRGWQETSVTLMCAACGTRASQARAGWRLLP